MHKLARNLYRANFSQWAPYIYSSLLLVVSRLGSSFEVRRSTECEAKAAECLACQIEIWIINTYSKSWSVLSFVYFMTFYKLQNSSKVYTQNVGNMAFQGLYREIFPEPQRFLAPSALAPPPPPPKTKLYAFNIILNNILNIIFFLCF